MNSKQILLTLIMVLPICLATAQTKEDSKKLIRDFIAYAAGSWNIDTVVSKYVLLRDEESKVATREQRKNYIGMAVSHLASEMKKCGVSSSELTVLPYEQADPSLQIMNLGLDYSNRSFVVTNKTKTFTRYFLIRGRKIEAFVLFRDKAFLLLN